MAERSAVGRTQLYLHHNLVRTNTGSTLARVLIIYLFIFLSGISKKWKGRKLENTKMLIFFCRLVLFFSIVCGYGAGGGAMMGKGQRGRGCSVISQSVGERTGTTCPSLNVSNCGDLAKSRPSHTSRAALGCPPPQVSPKCIEYLFIKIYVLIHIFFLLSSHNSS